MGSIEPLKVAAGGCGGRGLIGYGNSIFLLICKLLVLRHLNGVRENRNSIRYAGARRAAHSTRSVRRVSSYVQTPEPEK